MPHRASPTLCFSGHHCSWALLLKSSWTMMFPVLGLGSLTSDLRLPFQHPMNLLLLEMQVIMFTGFRVGGMLLEAPASGESPTLLPPSAGYGGQEHCAHLPLNPCLDTYWWSYVIYTMFRGLDFLFCEWGDRIILNSLGIKCVDVWGPSWWDYRFIKQAWGFPPLQLPTEP